MCRIASVPALGFVVAVLVSLHLSLLGIYPSIHPSWQLELLPSGGFLSSIQGPQPGANAQEDWGHTNPTFGEECLCLHPNYCRLPILRTQSIREFCSWQMGDGTGRGWEVAGRRTTPPLVVQPAIWLDSRKVFGKRASKLCKLGGGCPLFPLGPPGFTGFAVCGCSSLSPWQLGEMISWGP